MYIYKERERERVRERAREREREAPLVLEVIESVRRNQTSPDAKVRPLPAVERTRYIQDSQVHTRQSGTYKTVRYIQDSQVHICRCI